RHDAARTQLKPRASTRQLERSWSISETLLMPLIVVSPGASHAVCEGTVKPLRLTMLWSKNGGGLTTGGSSNILAVYDLDLYLSRQAELQRQGGNGFFETTEEFFAQTPTDFPGSELKGHEVAPGTGVMMLADVMFRFTDEKHHRLHWHIEKVRQRGRIASHAFQLDVQAIGRFSDAGDP